MNRGTRIPTEASVWPSPETGAVVRQMTNRPTNTTHMHYESTSISADSEWLIAASQRPDTGWDLYACRLDGSDLTRVNSEAPSSGAGFTPDGKHLLYFEGSDLRRMCLADGADEVISHMEGLTTSTERRGVRSYDGKYYITTLASVDDRTHLHLVRWNMATGEADTLAEGIGIGHLNANPGGPELSFHHATLDGNGVRQAVPKTVHCDTLEGLRFEEFRQKVSPLTAHSFWLGKTNLRQATRQWPVHGLIVADPSTGEFETVAEGPYFWHSGASYDGKWIVADTHFPDRGLWLVNVGTRKSERLCYAFASQGHDQMTHPHPNLSDDGRYAVYTSDRTGTSQVYLVEVPEKMRARLSEQ